jgi:hypothetical protein
MVTEKKCLVCGTKEFEDFIHVMEAFNYKYKAVNYLKLIRNTYIRRPILERMVTF